MEQRIQRQQIPKQDRNKAQWELLMRLTVSNDAKTYLDNYKERNIIKNISNIQFNQLQDLSLNANCIQSIQSINQIYMPKIQKISLMENNIRTLKPLRKCNIPKIKILLLTQQPPIQYNSQFCDPISQLNCLNLIQFQIHNKEMISHYNRQQAFNQNRRINFGDNLDDFESSLLSGLQIGLMKTGSQQIVYEKFNKIKRRIHQMNERIYRTIRPRLRLLRL